MTYNKEYHSDYYKTVTVPNKKVHNKKCLVCKISFVTTKSNKKLCSDDCVKKREAEKNRQYVSKHRSNWSVRKINENKKYMKQWRIENRRKS